MSNIKRLTIRRFKQIEDLTLDLTRTTLLIGANNAGKSSALQALHFAVAVAQTAKLIQGNVVHWASDKLQLSFNPSQLLYSPVSDVMSLAFGGNLTESPAAQIEFEIECEDDSKCLISIRAGRNRNIAVKLIGRHLGERLMKMDQPFTIYAPGLAGVPKEERYMSPGLVRRIVARGDANLVLRNVLYMLLKAEKQAEEALNKAVVAKEITLTERFAHRGPWRRFLADMAHLFPGIVFEIPFDEERDEIIEVFFTLPNAPRLPIDAAGTSILQASQILAYITLFQPAVLILDEPDSHLHPNNQRQMCNLVSKLSEGRNFRVLISTHSRHVLDSLRETSEVVWMNAGTRVDFESVTAAAMLMQLGALDSVDYFANGELKCLFATEDSSEESLKALEVLLSASGFDMQCTEIRSYLGCSKVEAALVLRAFLSEKAPAVKFIVHRDRDYMDPTAAAKFETQIDELGAFPFLTEFSDVEGYFLNAAHFASVNRGLSVERAREIINQATAATAQQSVAALINIRTEAAIRSRNGGPAHNAGELAARANADYQNAPDTWRRGKIVLKAAKSLLQQELGRAPIILSISEHIEIERLRQLRDVVWPAVNDDP
jgi:ABC-type cobalamin/Fe3+-siderophores transport system ATPase subunit